VEIFRSGSASRAEATGGHRVAPRPGDTIAQAFSETGHVTKRGTKTPGRRRKPEKLLLRNSQSAGDIVMLTAAVRDLHRCYPGRYLTDVRTSCADLWIGNPWLTPLEENDPSVRVIDCHYPIIHRSNHTPYHFLFGFIEDLNDQLGLRIQPTEYRGDIHVTPEEKRWFEAVEGAHGLARPFWLFASGGKWDYTIKWWDAARYQEVVDHFRGRIEFAQIGESHHHHPPIEGVVDLRGKTSLRQLVRLMYHAQGALSAVSVLMHLAAAVEAKPGMPKNRPCVVIAGGREPPHFTAYPHHQFIHTVGALKCCDDGGCWKSRTVKLGDGDVKDNPEELCLDVVGTLPRCMDMISSAEVIRRIEMYFAGGALSYLTR
jgi:ADP-heptose:LPS heptosyltransferase